jgi:hypothetical protein
MYWFGRGDLAAAEAWWKRALVLDGSNVRAHECLRLIAHSVEQSPHEAMQSAQTRTAPSPLPADSPTRAALASAAGLGPPPTLEDRLFGDERITEPGVKAESPLSSAPPGPPSASYPLKASELGGHVLIEQPRERAPSAPLPPLGPLPRVPSLRPGEADLSAPKAPARSSTSESPRPSSHMEPQRARPPGSDPDVPIDVDVDVAAWALLQQQGGEDPDPFDFASAGARTPSHRLEHHDREKATPWDFGPSKTAAMTLEEDADEEDALPEPTPLPEVEAARFFGRHEPGPPPPPPDLHTDSFRRAQVFQKPSASITRVPYGSSHGREEPMMPPQSMSSWANPMLTPSFSITEAQQPYAAPGLEKNDIADIQIDDPVELSTPKSSRAIPETAREILQQAHDRFQLHDFAGVVDLLERIKPSDDHYADARSLLATSRNNLSKMYESKVGALDRVPRLLVSSEEIIWLNLNHRAGFILSQIDGSVSYDDLIALSGMSRLDTLKILAELIQERVIGT